MHGRSTIPATDPSHAVTANEGGAKHLQFRRGWRYRLTTSGTDANDVDRKAVVRPLAPAASCVYAGDQRFSEEACRSVDCAVSCALM